MSLKLGDTLNYDPLDLEASSYSLMKIVPLSGSQNVSVTAAAGTDLTFEIPVQAINFARSYFSADVSIPIPGAGGSFNWKHDGICPFESMQVFTRGGQYLLNLQSDCTDYSRIVISADSSRRELQNGDATGPLFRSGASAKVPEESGSNALAPYWQQQYATSAGDNLVLNYRIMFPMSMMKETVLSVDKSILFREVLVCKLSSQRVQISHTKEQVIQYHPWVHQHLLVQSLIQILHSMLHKNVTPLLSKPLTLRRSRLLVSVC